MHRTHEEWQGWKQNAPEGGFVMEAIEDIAEQAATIEKLKDEVQRLNDEIEAIRDPESAVQNYFDLGRELNLRPYDSIFEAVVCLRERAKEQASMIEAQAKRIAELENLVLTIDSDREARQSKNAEWRRVGKIVLDGLDARIDAAPSETTPLFDGIAELHDLVHAKEGA